MTNFATELDALITKYKNLGDDIGEMAAEMQGALDGLNDELRDD